MDIRKLCARKPVDYFLRGVVVLLLVGVVIWGAMVGTNVTFYNHDPYITVNTGWVQVIDGEEIPLETAQDAVVPADGSAIVLQRTISDQADNQTMLFYTSHQEVTVYIDGDLEYELTCPAEFAFYGSTGRNWVEIPIREGMIGETLRLEFYTPFAAYSKVPNDLYYVVSDDIDTVRIDYMWMRNTVALALISLAVITYVNATIWKYHKLRRYLLVLADLYLFTGLWVCGEINVLTMWTGHATLSSMLAMMILRIIPVVFHQFVMTILDEKPWWLRLLGVVAWGNLLGSFALQFIWQVSLVETLGVTIGIFVVSCVVYIVGILVENLRRKTPTTYDWISYAMMIFPVASIGEICYYLYTGDSDQLTGLFVAAACVGYALFAHVLLVRNEVKNDVEKRALEQQQRALERKPLYQQINAHFLFNTLNTISAYCKEEPAKADRAVNLLSQYMRRYTKLVDASDYVPFKEEVTLMDLYLDILNLRYEEEYTLVVDASFEDFLLPPLTLQTVVENAVIHGLHKFVNHGVIYVQTQRYGKIIEMIVSDNGCGFDMRAKCKGSGVGLQNLSRRLRIMGGDMEVDSLPGNGTRIIMHVPLQPHEEEEQGEIV